MNHSEAIESKAAERYLLDELVDPERDAFEEHFIDCSACGETIRAGVAMLANGREVVRQEPSFRRFRTLKWIPTHVAAAALAVVGTLALRAPQPASIPLTEVVMPGPSISVGETRSGVADTVITFEDKVPLYITRDIDRDPSYPRYRLELRNASGKTVLEVEAPEAQVHRNGGISFVLRPLPAGRYVLATLGVRKDGNRSEIARTSVVVQ